MRLFGRVAIIGFGRVGAFIARHIRQKALADAIVAVDRAEDPCRRALAAGLADEAFDDIRTGVEGCDLIVLALPSDACGMAARQIRHAIRHGAIVTDTASVKENVIAAIMPHLPDGSLYVPAHPLFTIPEQPAPSAGRKLCIITPVAHTDIRAIEKVTALWEACGAAIEIMPPKRHDLIVSLTSYAPFLLACTLIGTAAGFEYEKKHEFMKYAQADSGFRDFAQIASSGFVPWHDILPDNRDAALEVLNACIANLLSLRDGIEQEDASYLRGIFEGIGIIGSRVSAAMARESAAVQTGAEGRRKASGSEL